MVVLERLEHSETLKSMISVFFSLFYTIHWKYTIIVDLEVVECPNRPETITNRSEIEFYIDIGGTIFFLTQFLYIFTEFSIFKV